MSPAAGMHSVVVAADWPLLAAAYRTRGSLRIVDDVLPVPGDTPLSESEFRKALQNCQPERRHNMLLDQVGTLAATAMGLPADSLDPSTGFFQLGMDSLMSVALQRALSDSLGEFLPASVVFDYPTVYSLTDYLATTLPELIETDDQQPADVHEELCEAELLQQLSERMRRIP
jgi:acyl carrier protein